MKTHTLVFLCTMLAVVSCKQGALTEGGPACDLDMQAIGPGNQTLATSEPGTTQPVPQEPRACVVPEKNPEANLDYNISFTNFTPDQEEKMRNALVRMKLVINSQAFKKRVLGHSYNGKVTFVDNEGLNNEQIYYKILEGVETLQPEVDEEMDLDVTMYYSSNSTVGYTYPNTNRIWVNSKFFNGYTLGKVAANITHEWTHKIGFGHASRSTASRPYSVPYGIGSIMQELVDGM